MSAENFSCTDLAALVNRLNFLRKTDDSVILELNDALPTKSFDANSQICKNHCSRFTEVLTKLATERMQLLEKCIEENERKAAQVQGVEAQILRGASRQLRFERDVEEVVTERSSQAVKDRCSKIL
ncbi:unnamed protein product [Caenorhabditis auriculariae]|uniref:Protein MIX23 n=1 Tax=Caenorhabditis auriculariae TaxID=2777116 RepID=A0A8S1GTS3_9PELO|nr:unnamed protein product [Caenorhabditis auriculariae]